MNIAKPLKTIKSLVLLVSASLIIVFTVEGQKPSVAVCFAKHFVHVSQMSVSSSGKTEFQRCTTPSPEQCDLSYALANGNYDGIKCLINAGYDFNVASGTYIGRNIPVTQAALYDPRMLELLFTSKTALDIDVTDTAGATPLYSVTTLLSSPFIHRPKGFSWEKVFKSAEVLLSKGAQPDPARNGMTPLIFQTELGRAKFLDLLLRYKASPNFQTPEGKTALMLAKDDPEIIGLLLTNGANIYLRDKAGKTAIFYAIEGCQVNKVLKLLSVDSGLLSSVDARGRSAVSHFRATDSSTDCRKLAEVMPGTFPNRRQR